MKNKQGFTIVELLIVIVVIAILATISVVAYTGIQNRTYDSIVEQDLANAARKIELTRADLGRYPRNGETPTGFKFTKSAYLTTASNALYCVNHNTDEYALGAISKSGTGYMLTQYGVRKNVTVTAESVCQTVGTAWTSPPASAPRSAIHGYFPGGGSPNYTDGWANGWSWTSS